MKKKLIKLMSVVLLALPMLFVTSSIYSKVIEFSGHRETPLTEEEALDARIREEAARAQQARVLEQIRIGRIFAELFFIASLDGNIRAENMQIFESLLTQGVTAALLNGRVNHGRFNQHGETLLFLAIRNNHIEILRMLLAAGANPNLTRALDGATPLLVATQNRNSVAIEMLFSAGANIDQADHTGITPLIEAISRGHEAVAQMLIGRRANVNKVTNGGISALILASHQGSMDLIRLLLDCGADVDKVTIEGETALTTAVRKNDIEKVRILLDAGSDLSQISRDGLSALGIAREYGLHEIAEIIWEESCRRAKIAREERDARKRQRANDKDSRLNKRAR